MSAPIKLDGRESIWQLIYLHVRENDNNKSLNNLDGESGLVHSRLDINDSPAAPSSSPTGADIDLPPCLGSHYEFRYVHFVFTVQAGPDLHSASRQSGGVSQTVQLR